MIFRKLWVRILAVLGLLAALLYFIALPMATQQLVATALDYPPHTFEHVLNDSALLHTSYYLGDKRTPADYGYTEVQEVSFPSLYDTAITLSAWWIPSARRPDAPVIFLNHGRTSCRLKPMKYLQLYRDLGLDTAYNFMLTDFRNSGQSTPARTAFGNKFAEDLAAASLHVARQYGGRRQLMHSFSMGAAATGVLLWRPDLREALARDGVTIERIILDSPLSNVKATLMRSVTEMQLPQPLIDRAMTALAAEITAPDGTSVFEDLRFSTLFEDVTAPVLILQDTTDSATPWPILEAELARLPLRPHWRLVQFQPAQPDIPTHVRMYVQHPEAYRTAVAAFLQEE